MKVKKKVAAIMFLDVKGYSKLSEPQLNRFFEVILPEVASLVTNCSPFFKNSWGDAIVCASDDILKLVACAIDTRDFFTNFNWQSHELPKLTARLSLHVGPLFWGHDPIQEREGIVGTQVNLAARVEPVTLPGHVWATDNFVSMLELESQDLFAWDSLGERQLAKEWGAKRLYRIRRIHEDSRLPSLSEVNSETTGESIASKVDLCKHLLDMGSEEQKVVALDMLGKISTSESLSLLVTYAKRKDQPLSSRKMAILSLAEANSQIVVPDLLEMLVDSDEPEIIIGSLISALGELPDLRSFDTLAAIALSGDDSRYNARLKGAALLSLARHKDARAVPIIRKLLESDEREVIPSAIGAAGVLQSKALSEPLMAVALASELFDPSTRGAAIEAIVLAGTGPMPSVFGGAATMAKDINEHLSVRLLAISVVAMFGNAASKEVLTEIAGRLNDDCSAEALRGLFIGEELAVNHKQALEKGLRIQNAA